jgi:hypothetical protein
VRAEEIVRKSARRELAAEVRLLKLAKAHTVIAELRAAVTGKVINLPAQRVGNPCTTACQATADS